MCVAFCVVVVPLLVLVVILLLLGVVVVIILEWGTILIINGDEMILHYKALKKTERHQLSRDIRSKAIAEHLFLLLDANPESLSKTYTIKVVQASPLKIQLTPKAEALRKLIATIDAEISNRGYVAQLVLNESNGDKTRWRFTNPVLNTPLDGALFTFP